MQIKVVIQAFFVGANEYQTFDQNVYKLSKFSTLQMYQYRVSVFVKEISVFLLQTNLALNDGLLVDMNK